LATLSLVHEARQTIGQVFTFRDDEGRRLADRHTMQWSRFCAVRNDPNLAPGFADAPTETTSFTAFTEGSTDPGPIDTESPNHCDRHCTDIVVNWTEGAKRMFAGRQFTAD